MSWKLEFDSGTKKDFSKIDHSDRKKILQSLKEFVDSFSDDFERSLMQTGHIKKLKGGTNNVYRLRLRTYRVIYEKQNDCLVIFVVRVGHRKDVYK
ncbi:type II toxin-antitoxin system RelE family toxin [Campylobacter hyointestinalis]|uniref:type II toxin-antitoxin system RelE family toxin n=1 Tax=Campylobacter hyointestinalis TaxID=198 RepID=UPI000DCC8D79|nr:type II toxin-antitoxin system RelE/ParE family toxin [Campylobacter hyointestinalis]RAZ50589.1 hypothetical protein CHL9004_01115 [Campylobacter hyointestinalis subsp. lawsonii]RAZ52744.1 hypothetical protein CHL10075_00885 [Campylobacter hyointestinalis subsp. lawsonii]RAZ60858.1 hypothetical protein CHL10071_04280 [Campylobacter hyointestinalis subsp. lawsonii]